MKDILAKLETIANELDQNNKIVEADAVTDIMRKLAQFKYPDYEQKPKFQNNKPAPTSVATPKPAPVSPAAQGFNYQKDFKGVVSDKIGVIGTYLQDLNNYVNKNIQYADPNQRLAIQSTINRLIAELHTLQTTNFS